ncbi:MAG: S8 family serine peptidase [Deltaproteobacteria bacterium]|nr:S8 family serine peptidase [Deltaproteobacteria bacterium]
MARGLLCLRNGCLAFSVLMTALHARADEYIVKVKSTFSVSATAKRLQEDLDLKFVDEHRIGRLLLMKNDTVQESMQTMQSIQARPEVEYVVPNIKLHAFIVPDDPLYAQQWALKKVQAESAWDLQEGKKDTVVAVIDTGVDWRHEDLKPRIWTNSDEITGNGKDDDGNGYVDDTLGWDFFGNDNNPNDETSTRNPGHGTHCAGIIAATGNNGKGVSGIAPGITIMPIRFLGADGSGDLMNGIKAIDYAILNKAQIISASWGAAVPRSQATPLIEAIERANQANVVFVAAAANDGQSNDVREVYPANAGLPNVISVAASDVNDQKPQWSNYGRATVDLSSPGAGILSTIPGNQYKELSGTSMATPLVAGLVALLASQAMVEGRSYKPVELKAILQASGAKVAIETACHCRVVADSALTLIRDNKLTVVPNALSLKSGGNSSFYAIGGSGNYSFTSSQPEIASITADGKLTAHKDGETFVKVVDGSGAEALSREIYVGGSSAPPGGQCPLQDPVMCQLLCLLNPALPWCSGN